MLRTLQIRNLAIIEALELEFATGFCVLTGETGAGKSILIDALGLVIGSRADSHLVRAGAERAEVSAEFDTADSAGARAWLDTHALDDDASGRCLIRRVVQTDGRTRAFVNGGAVTAGDLRELGTHLVEIFGQGESQSLLHADTQREAIDAFGGHVSTLEAVAAAAAECLRIEHAIDHLRNAQSRDPAQLDYLQHQLQELDAMDLQPGETGQLDAEHRRLANAGRLLEEGAAAQAALYGGDLSAWDQLTGALNLLRGLLPLHGGFGEAEELASAAQTQVRAAADSIRNELDRLELDPDRLTELEQRIGSIHDLARKHRVRADELVQRHEQLREELAGLEDSAGRLKLLEQQREVALTQYRTASAVLTTARRDASLMFSGEVTSHIRELGMPNARFDVSIETPPTDRSSDRGAQRPSPHGNDRVRFDFSANPGQPPRALAKVASGGELSRVSLAIQGSLHGAHLRQGAGAASMIFDEVDAGIGGGVAEIVGRQLRALGTHRQVLCVTHLAQVAAQGSQHFSIRKESSGDETFTRVESLDASRRTDEIARMLGGQEITAATRALAKDLLIRAQT